MGWEMREIRRRSAGDKKARIGACQTSGNQFSSASSLSDMWRKSIRIRCRSGAVHRAERAPQGRGYSILLRWVAEISCAGRSAVTSSQRNEHVRAFSKSRAGVYCDLRLHCVSLGACVECVPAIAPTLSHRRESRRAQLRSDNDCVGQLRSCCSPAAGQRTSPSRSIFQNSGVDSAVGQIAVSWRPHFRARAARGVGSSGGSSSPLLDVNQTAKPHLFLASPAERPIPPAPLSRVFASIAKAITNHNLKNLFRKITNEKSFNRSHRAAFRGEHCRGANPCHCYAKSHTIHYGSAW